VKYNVIAILKMIANFLYCERNGDSLLRLGRPQSDAEGHVHQSTAAVTQPAFHPFKHSPSSPLEHPRNLVSQPLPHIFVNLRRSLALQRTFICEPKSARHRLQFRIAHQFRREVIRQVFRCRLAFDTSYYSLDLHDRQLPSSSGRKDRFWCHEAPDSRFNRNIQHTDCLVATSYDITVEPRAPLPAYLV
jgi:hypothetical protein